VYHVPHPPVRQTELSSRISDSFYREPFMSPCLSGWDDGEAKADYMHLCHQVLSRSQLNSVAKLREAGIISNNLIVLPSLSNVSLANNGIHIAYGSRTLTRAIADGPEGESRGEEKRLGDLAIKILEHFLVLFVGTYSAAPYRIQESARETIAGLAGIVPALATWSWRAMSECLRADHRGNLRISVYQWMVLIAMAYLALMLTVIPSEGPTPNLAAGLVKVTSAGVIVLLQVLWVGLFLYYGRSRVTGSVVSFHIVAERV
jgi:hypothetical protein